VRGNFVLTQLQISESRLSTNPVRISNSSFSLYQHAFFTKHQDCILSKELKAVLVENIQFEQIEDTITPEGLQQSFPNQNSKP
jgi:hypothetical protein